MSRFPPIPESSKAYVALLKGVKIPHVPNHGQTNVSYNMIEIDPWAYPFRDTKINTLKISL